MSGPANRPNPPLLLALTTPEQPSAFPTVLLSVTNTSKNKPYTILSWSSPLDPLALQLGLFSLVVLPSGRRIQINAIMLKRHTPPTDDAYVTIEPGATKQQEVLIREPSVDVAGLAGKTVLVSWLGSERPIAVWEAKKEDLSGEDLGSWEGWSDAPLHWDPSTTQPAEVEVVVADTP